MPVGTDVSCEDMFADESDFEFHMEEEEAGTSAAAQQALPQEARGEGQLHTSLAQVNQRNIFTIHTPTQTVRTTVFSLRE